MSCKPAYDISHSLDPAVRVSAIKGFRVLHADALLLSCMQESCHAAFAII